jgi:hypothetical protein
MNCAISDIIIHDVGVWGCRPVSQNLSFTEVTRKSAVCTCRFVVNVWTLLLQTRFPMSSIMTAVPELLSTSEGVRNR